MIIVNGFQPLTIITKRSILDVAAAASATIFYYIFFLYLKTSRNASKLQISWRNSIHDALRDLAPFVQFEKREKHPWRSVTFNKVTGSKDNNPPWAFFTFFELYKWYQIAQIVSYEISTDASITLGFHFDF